MGIDKSKVEKLIEKARARQKAAEANYQDTGENRYYNTMVKNEALADTLEDALKSEKYIRMAKMLSNDIRNWAATLESWEYENPKTREECVHKILSEITLTAKGLIL